MEIQNRFTGEVILTVATLQGANLAGANLQGATLRSADLQGATLPEQVTFEEFRDKVVPWLCEQGGKTIQDLKESWTCHKWENCPMHEALGIMSESEAPPHLRIWVSRFVQLFDAGLLPYPSIE